MDRAIIDKWSGIVSVGTWIFSWILFWNYTGEPVGSFRKAAIAWRQPGECDHGGVRRGICGE